MEIDGIGKALAEKAVTLVRTGQLPQLNELLAEIPESVLAMLRIPASARRRPPPCFTSWASRRWTNCRTPAKPAASGS